MGGSLSKVIPEGGLYETFLVEHEELMNRLVQLEEKARETDSIVCSLQQRITELEAQNFTGTSTATPEALTVAYDKDDSLTTEAVVSCDCYPPLSLIESSSRFSQSMLKWMQSQDGALETIGPVMPSTFKSLTSLADEVQRVDRGLNTTQRVRN